MHTNDTSLIHARGLTKRFGTFTAVDGISFDVHAGEAFGFLGPNGAGKTSTMRMIACASPVTAGDLRVLDMIRRNPTQAGSRRASASSRSRTILIPRLRFGRTC